MLLILQIVEGRADHNVDQHILAIVHHHFRVGEVAVYRVRLINGILAEDDHRAFHLGTGVVAGGLGVELAILQRAADGLCEAGEFSAVEHAHGDVAVLHVLAFAAVLFLGGARSLLSEIRLYRGRFDLAQSSNMEEEQQGNHQCDRQNGADDGEHHLLTAANVLFARGALVVSLSHVRVLLQKTVDFNLTVTR